MTKHHTCRHRNRYALLLGALALSLITSACFLRPKKKQGNGTAASGGLIDAKSIFFDRLGDGESARLQFKTRAQTFCELSFYSQEPAVKPTKNEPTVVPCSSPSQARSEFTETLTGLRTDTLYFVVIVVWTDAQSKSRPERLTVKESPGSSSVVPGGDGKVRDLHVARFNVPLLTAEVHHHVPDQPLELSAVRDLLGRKTGCQQGMPDTAPPFRTAASDIGVENLATADFATATAKRHPDYAERLLLNFKSLNDGSDQPWTLIYQRGGEDAPPLNVRPVSRILNMEMESSEITAFEQPQLGEAVDPLRLDPTKPLRLAWTATDNLPEYAYMTVQIGRPDYDKAIYCVFPATKRSAVIDPQLLQGLDDGKHVILAELSASKIWVKDSWLVTTYDWRSGRVEK